MSMPTIWRFSLQFFHSRSDAAGVFCNAFLGNCLVDDFRQPCRHIVSSQDGIDGLLGC